MSNKQLETLRARAALAGIVLLESRNDNEQPVYVATRWALTQEMESLEAVSAWLDRVAGLEPVSAGEGSTAVQRAFNARAANVQPTKNQTPSSLRVRMVAGRSDE